MNVISYRKIRDFVALHADSEISLRAWYRTAKKAHWQNLAEVRQVYPHADLVGVLTVFNIRGNRYRLVAGINYQYQQIFIKAIMTHEEYDKDNWKT
jgi:mRNA interferase HigB